MSPLGPAIVAFCLIFLTSTGAGFLMQLRARRRESRVVERVGIHAGMERAEGQTPVLIRPSAPQNGSALHRVLARIQSDARITRLCERAGQTASASATLRACGICALVSGAAAILILPRSFALVAIPVMLGNGLLPLLILRRKVRKRLAMFESQFPDGLEFIARSMRAGHAFSVSLEMLYKEFDDPIAGEFRRTFEEQNLGLPLEVALAKFAERVPLVDVRFFTSAVLLQRKTGGNLTEILDNLAHLIRERYKLRGKIRAISAHGRMTGKALTGIPVIVGALMLWMNHDFAVFFFSTTLGREMLVGSAALQVIGYAVINKIVNIEV